MRDKNFAYLDIMCWAMALNGEHYMASAKYGDARIPDIKYELTETQAGRLNKKDGGRTWQPGDMSGRFFTEKACIEKSIEVIREEWPEAVAIIDDSASAQPIQIYWCHDINLMNKANSIWRQMEILYNETNDPWTPWPDTMQKLCDDWDAIVAQI